MLAEAAGPVRLLRTLYLPGEEACFYGFESDRQDLAADAGLWAALGFDRVQSVHGHRRAVEIPRRR